MKPVIFADVNTFHGSQIFFKKMNNLYQNGEKIRADKKDGKSWKELADKYEVSVQTVRSMCKKIDRKVA